MDTRHVYAACLTPPSPGGVAVIELVGAEPISLLNPLLKARRPVDLTNMSADELRFARLMDGDETIDDVIVTVCRRASDQVVVDMTLHGGPRVVQRALLLLKRVGAQIVDQTVLLSWTWSPRGPRQGPWLANLSRAKTPAVVRWLMRMRVAFAEEIGRIVNALKEGEAEPAGAALHALCLRGRRLPYVLDGVRVVLAGGPSVGKSTLANALAGREASIVSPLDGTTRDWVEHPTDILGLPFTLVDTAGLRESDDPIEREAVRRAYAQRATADLVLCVMDISRPLADAELELLQTLGGRKTVDHPVVYVWNKLDLSMHPDQEERIKRLGAPGIKVSSRTGEGIDILREIIVSSLGLAAWETDGPTPFDEQGLDVCRAALSELSTGLAGVHSAIRLLNILISEHAAVARSSTGGV
ncbi:MAG: GTP-binding protein [Phycisphaerales bacterium]|nr:GTP-binding protein [Phycisphaerales bacterium]